MRMKPERLDECCNDIIGSVAIMGVDVLIGLERSRAGRVALGTNMPGATKGKD